jgi:hypothetical protein
MPTLKTDKGIIYDATFANVSYDGAFITYIRDERPLSVIADEFEGVTHIEFTDIDGTKTEFDGYSVLYAVVRDYRFREVQVSLRKPDGGD